MTNEELAAIIARAEKATPGPWEDDSQDSRDDRGKVRAYAVFGPDGKVLVDTLNSDAAEIHEEPDEDGINAWDEIGRRNVAFIGCGAYSTDRRILTCCKGYCYDASGKTCNAVQCPGCGGSIIGAARLSSQRRTQRSSTQLCPARRERARRGRWR